jgi:poly(A) polymerase
MPLGSAIPGPLARRVATDIVQLLQSQGHIAYFAGGCVRDELLGLTPSDYDIATDATPPRLISLFRNTRHVGAHFGVVHVHQDGIVVEVATFRADGDYTDQRRPDSVRFSTPVEDAQRRDFTVNALFLDPLATPAPHGATQTHSPLGGVVIDHVNGLADLKSRVLRAVGDPQKRLAEDHLRAWRAPRLAAKLGFTIDPATADAIRHEAKNAKGVSRERIGDEVRRMLLHPRRAEAVAMLRDLALDGPSLGEPCLPDHAVATLASLPHDAAVPLCLAAWAIDRHANPDRDALVPRWRKALCLSNDESDTLKDTLSIWSQLATDWPTWTVAQRKRLAARACFGWSHLILNHTDPSHAKGVRAQVAHLSKTPSGIAPPPWVNGDDLIALGMKPGKAFKVLLDRLYDEQLEDRLTSREQGLELAKAWSV